MNTLPKPSGKAVSERWPAPFQTWKEAFPGEMTGIEVINASKPVRDLPGVPFQRLAVLRELDPGRHISELPSGRRERLLRLAGEHFSGRSLRSAADLLMTPGDSVNAEPADARSGQRFGGRLDAWCTL